MENARVLLEVVAGLITLQPMPEYTKQWAITSEQWQNWNTNTEGSEIEFACNSYAKKLQHGGMNWVQTTWIYL